MEKVLVIIPDNNKGKYISKGFSYAFKELSYYVSEKKIYDLNRDEIKSYSPDIIFSFWSDITQNSELKDFINNYNDEKTVLIHYAEAMKDIPADYKDKKNNYCFSYDGQKKQHTMPAVNVKDYKRKFTGYKYLITFAGNPAYKNRELILSKLIYNFGIINIFCRSYDFYKSVDEIYKSKLLNDKYIDLYRESYRGYVEKQTELAYIYSSTKVNLDLENPNKKSVNYRCMEILASGGFLISKYNNSIIKYISLLISIFYI